MFALGCLQWTLSWPLPDPRKCLLMQAGRHMWEGTWLRDVALTGKAAFDCSAASETGSQEQVS